MDTGRSGCDSISVDEHRVPESLPDASTLAAWPASDGSTSMEDFGPLPLLPPPTSDHHKDTNHTNAPPMGPRLVAKSSGASKTAAQPTTEDDDRRSFLWTIISILFFLDWRLLPFVNMQKESRQDNSRSQTPPAQIGTHKRSSSSPESPPRDKERKRSPRPSVSSNSSITATIRRALYNDIRIKRSEKKTLVLDLDETLIHSMTRGGRGFGASHMVEVKLSDQHFSCIYYVDKRPYCHYFLDVVSEWYNVVVFTASVRDYADPVIDWLEREQGRRIFSRRLYRNDCISDSSGYVKDLNVLGEDLNRVLLVDNSPLSYSLQKYNGIGIEGWVSDPSDRALLHLLPLLNALRNTTDVRSVLCLQDGEKCWATAVPFSVPEVETETDN